MNHSRPTLEWIAAILLVCLLVVAVQTREGGYSAGYGAYPDESAHFVGGLLVRDYVAAGGGDPFAFARNYYLYQPYFAIGYWPPLFYALEGVWMLIFGYSRFSMMVLVGAISGSTALLLFGLVRKWAGFLWAIPTVALFLLVPSVEWSSSVVMTDMAVTLVAFLTTIAAGRFFESEDRRWAVATGVLGGLAVLTKYSSVFVFVPLVVLILADRRWKLLAQAKFWAIPGLVVLVAGPWVWWSRNFLTDDVRFFDRGSLAFRLTQLQRCLQSDFGIVLEGILAVALIWGVMNWKRLLPTQRLMIAQLPCLALFLFASPAGMEQRYFVPAYPGLLATLPLAAAALWKSKSGPWVFAAGVLVFGVFHKSNFAPLPSGVGRQIALSLRDRVPAGESAVLVPTTSEGAMIAELASVEKSRPKAVLVRPSKLFAKMNWLGGSYTLLTTDVHQMISIFDRYPIDTVILANRADQSDLPHDEILRQMLKHESSWHLEKTYPDPSGESFEVYQRDARPDLGMPPLLGLLRDRMPRAQR